MDERSGPRVEVDQPAEVEVGGGKSRVLVYNLSVSGCMIDGSDADVLGQRISLQLGDQLRADGIVAWQRGSHKGIRFDRLLEVGIIDALGFGLTTVDRRSQPAPSWPDEPDDLMPPTAELREHRRVLVDRHVMCERGDERAPVLLYDLSVGGCMFESETLLPGLGDLVAITLAGSSYNGAVAWAVGVNVGVSFVENLHPAVVEHYGFTPCVTRFRIDQPRDRFGRLLPALPSLCA